MTVIGSHGLYQIDETAFCMSVMQTGTLSGSPNSYSSESNLSLYTFTTSINSPVFGVYIPPASGYFGNIVKTSLSGSVWTVTIGLFVPYSAGGSSLNVSLIKWFVFGRPTVSGGGYGLEVYDASSNLKFSSNWKTKTISGAANYTINSANKYAIVGGQVSYNRNLDVELLTDFTFYFREAVYGFGFNSTSGGIFSTEYLVYENQGPGTGGGSTGSTTYGISQPAFAVDITEYI